MHPGNGFAIFRYYDICRKLGTCQLDSTNFEINEIALSIVRGVTELDKFFDCLTSMGIKFEWDDLGRYDDLQNFFNFKSTRDTANELKKEIHKAVRIRHRIAHSGQAIAELTDEIFTSQLMLFELTAHSIINHINNELKTIKSI